MVNSDILYTSWFEDFIKESNSSVQFFSSANPLLTMSLSLAASYHNILSLQDVTIALAMQEWHTISLTRSDFSTPKL